MILKGLTWLLVTGGAVLVAELDPRANQRVTAVPLAAHLNDRQLAFSSAATAAVSAVSFFAMYSSRSGSLTIWRMDSVERAMSRHCSCIPPWRNMVVQPEPLSLLKA